MKPDTKRNYNKYASETENEQKLTLVELRTLMPFQGQNIFCNLLKNVQFQMFPLSWL